MTAEISYAKEILFAALYMLALINPIGEVFVLAAISSEFGPKGLLATSIKSSLFALAMLLLLAAFGHFILNTVFHVQLYSVRIAGGIILFAVGYKALLTGIFFEEVSKERLAEATIVPLASPLIAGPATITAAIAYPAEFGPVKAILAILIAMAFNFLIMLSSKFICTTLARLNLMAALVRVTGLVIATIAVEMVLAGIGDWYHAL